MGDCYFLATLASMAEVPSKIEALFETKEVNAAGIYMMYFFINGVKTPVIVDDNLPYRNGRLTMAKGKGGELWVCLLEKGWAKLHGSYARMAFGWPEFAGVHLSCVPSRHFSHDVMQKDKKKAAKFHQALLHADNKNFSIMCCTPGYGEGK